MLTGFLIIWLTLGLMAASLYLAISFLEYSVEKRDFIYAILMLFFGPVFLFVIAVYFVKAKFESKQRQ